MGKKNTRYLLIYLYLYELLPPLEQSQERKMQNLSGHGQNNQRQLLTSTVRRLYFLKSRRQKIISKSQTMKEKNSFDKLLKVNKSHKESEGFVNPDCSWILHNLVHSRFTLIRNSFTKSSALHASFFFFFLIFCVT